MIILCAWAFYYRDDLSRPLANALEGHDVYVIDRYAPDELTCDWGKVLFWKDYPTVQDLLNKIRPDCVVFSDIESFPQMALNIVARKRGIPTCIVQHGGRTHQLNYRVTSESPITLSPTSLSTLDFVIRSIGLDTIATNPQILKLFVDRKRHGMMEALRRNVFEFRRPDRYIEFAEDNTAYFKFRDGVGDDRFTLIGYPAFDDFFKTSGRQAQNPSQLLVVDASYGSENANRQFNKPFGMADKIEYLRKFAILAKLKNMSLVVKLHPICYEFDFSSLADIRIEREADLGSLISESGEVIVVSPTTWAPAIFHSKSHYVFLPPQRPEIPSLRHAKTQVRDLLTFVPAEVGDADPALAWEQVESFLFARDGRSVERLRTAIEQLSPAAQPARAWRRNLA